MLCTCPFFQYIGGLKVIHCPLQVFARISAYRDRMDGPQVHSLSCLLSAVKTCVYLDAGSCMLYIMHIFVVSNR